MPKTTQPCPHCDEAHARGACSWPYKTRADSWTLATERARAEAKETREGERANVTVTASREGIELGSAAVCGVNLSGNYREDRGYLSDTARELAPEAIDEARETLARLVATA